MKAKVFGLVAGLLFVGLGPQAVYAEEQNITGPMQEIDATERVITVRGEQYWVGLTAAILLEDGSQVALDTLQPGAAVSIDVVQPGNEVRKLQILQYP